MSRARARLEPELEPELELEGVGPLAEGGEVGLGGGSRRRGLGPALVVIAVVVGAVVVVGTTGDDGPPAPAASTVPATTGGPQGRPAYQLPPDVPAAVRVPALDLPRTQLRALVRRPKGPLALAVVDLPTGTTQQLTPLPSLTGDRLHLFAIGADTFVSDGGGSAIVVTANGTERRLNGAAQGLGFPSALTDQVWAVVDRDPDASAPQLRRVQLDDGSTVAGTDLPASAIPIGDAGDGGFLVTTTDGTYRYDPGGQPSERVSDGFVLGQVGGSWLERVCDDQATCAVRLRPADDSTGGLTLSGPVTAGGRTVVVPAADGARAAVLTIAGTEIRLATIDVASGQTTVVPGAPGDAAGFGAGSLGWSADGQVLLWTTRDRLQRWAPGAARPSPVTFLAEDSTLLDVVAFVAVPTGA